MKENTNYTLNFELAYSSSPSDIMVTLKDQNQATIYTGNSINGAGVNTFAMSLGTFTNPITLEITNSSNNQTFEIDNITLTQDGIEGVSYYTAQLVSAQDYYPFGTTLPGRTFQDDRFSGYRFSFNGQERDDEIAGVGNIMTAEFWEYDTRLGRRWNLDPKPQIFISDYGVMGNNPILFLDRLGDSKQSRHLDKEGKVIAEYNDGDNSVYKHQTAKTKKDVDGWRKHFNNNSGNGINIGQMSNIGIGVFNIGTFNSQQVEWPSSNAKSNNSNPQTNTSIEKPWYELDGGGPDAAGAGLALDLGGRNATLGGAIQWIETERGSEKFFTLKGGAQSDFKGSISGGPFMEIYWKSEEGKNLLASDMLVGESKFISFGYGLMVTYSWVENEQKKTVLNGLNFTLGFGYGAGSQQTKKLNK